MPKILAEKRESYPLGDSLPRDGPGSSWPRGWLGAGGADRIPAGHSLTCVNVGLTSQLSWGHSPDASSLQAWGESPPSVSF